MGSKPDFAGMTGGVKPVDEKLYKPFCISVGEIIKEMSDIDVVGMDSLEEERHELTSMGYRPSSPLPEPERADCSWIWSPVLPCPWPVLF